MISQEISNFILHRTNDRFFKSLFSLLCERLRELKRHSLSIGFYLVVAFVAKNRLVSFDYGLAQKLLK